MHGHGSILFILSLAWIACSCYSLELGGSYRHNTTTSKYTSEFPKFIKPDHSRENSAENTGSEDKTLLESESIGLGYSFGGIGYPNRRGYFGHHRPIYPFYRSRFSTGRLFGHQYQQGYYGRYFPQNRFGGWLPWTRWS